MKNYQTTIFKILSLTVTLSSWVVKSYSNRYLSRPWPSCCSGSSIWGLNLICVKMQSIHGWRLIQHLYINLKLFLETYVFNICFFVIYQCILVIFSLLVFSTLRFFLFQESVGTPSNQPNHNQHNHSENGKYPPIRNETILLKMVLIYYPKNKRCSFASA